MIDILFKYYGIDWAAMVATFFSIYYLGNKKPQGFLFSVFSSILWIAFNCLVVSIAGVLANMAFIALNLRGYWKWKKEHSVVVEPHEA
jgi:hypothetical protein